MNIQPYTKNAKKHPKKQIEQIANSIKEFGMHQPIVVDAQGVIIVGHGRYEALKHLKWSDAEILQHVKVADLTEEQAKAYRLADNKLNESDWDMTLVLEELKDLSEPMIDLTGFDRDLIIEPDEKDDEVPDVPEEPQSKVGDLYELGNHRVLCGDSTKMEDVERLMDGKKVDMVFTDPPYNANYKSRGENELLRKGIKNDSMSDSDFDEFIKAFVPSLLFATKAGAAFYVCCNWKDSYPRFYFNLQQSGINISANIVWNKGSCGMGWQDYRYQYEFIIYGFKEGAAHSWFGGRTETDVWEQSREARQSYIHPTQKPVDVPARALKNSSKADDIVLDIFLGSGSTLIAAEKTGRICYGMELDPKYIDVIVQRYVDYTGNNKIKRNGEEIVWLKNK